MPRDPELHARILDAAEAVLGEAGPHFSMVAVAERSGVSRTTVYRRFPTQGALLEALVRDRGVARETVAHASTRSHVLDAFVDLVRVRPPWQVSVEAVAERAGVGVATVYRHFKDRAGLFDAFSRERTPRGFSARLTGDGTDVRGDLEKLAGAAMRFLIEHPALLSAIVAPDPEAEAVIRPQGASLRQALGGYLAQQRQAGRIQGDPRVLTRSLMGMVIAAIVFDPRASAHDPEGAAAALVDLFLDGCAVDGTT